MSLALALGALATPGAFGAKGRARCLVAAAAPDPIVNLVVERLQTQFARVELSYDPKQAESRAGYDLILLTGPPDGCPPLEAAWAGRSRAADAYVLKTLAHRPLTVAASGSDWRGSLFAAYRLMDLLALNEPLDTLDSYYRPLAPRRYALVPGTSHVGRFYRPMLFDRTVHELPRYGVNGLLIVPGDQAATPVGRDGLPMTTGDDGANTILHPQYEEWTQFLAQLKRLRYDIFLLLPTVTPPRFERGQVQAYYAGQGVLPGFEEALGPFAERFFETLIAQFPQIDGFILSSVEGGMYAGVPLFIGPEDASAATAASERSARALDLYLAAAERVQARTGKCFGFWTHRSGITSDGIRTMREVMARHPGIVNIEDDYWPNAGWVMQPLLGYLPAELRPAGAPGRRFGMFLITADGEYYGGGSLPTAYPDPAARAARYAVENQAEMVLFRVDLHDLTNHGTLFNIDEIIPLMAAAQLWMPTDPDDKIWTDWVRRRFGSAAAPHLVMALRSCGDLLHNGFVFQGLQLIERGTIGVGAWQTGAPTGQRRFALFAKPGTPLVDKKPGDLLVHNDYYATELNVRAGSINEYRRRLAAAHATARRDLAAIDAAKPYLASGDYVYLHGIYDNYLCVTEALALLGEAAWAANLNADNFDRQPDPRALFEKAATDLLAFSQRLTDERGPFLDPPLQAALSGIVEDYRHYVEAHAPTR
ncbi:MAG: hypothetical protein M1457_01990 [bacterium]|nr:hypothetical protein [bacterium]